MRQISFRKAVPALLISASALGACTTTSAKPRATVQEAPREVLATPAPEPKRAVQVVAITEPLTLPGQLKPIGATALLQPAPVAPRRTVGAANAHARVAPNRNGTVKANKHTPE